MTLTELEQHLPWIPWRKPLQVNRAWYACRVCIANKGLLGQDVTTLPDNPESVEEHIRREHL